MLLKFVCGVLLLLSCCFCWCRRHRHRRFDQVVLAVVVVVVVGLVGMVDFIMIVLMWSDSDDNDIAAVWCPLRRRWVKYGDDENRDDDDDDTGDNNDNGDEVNDQWHCFTHHRGLEKSLGQDSHVTR